MSLRGITSSFLGDVLVYSSDYWKHEVNTLGSDLSISLLVEY